MPSYNLDERRHALPIPDAGRINCRGRCQKLNIPAGCALCGKCENCCDCRSCRPCLKRHPQSYICQVCGACKRSEAQPELRCACRHKPKAIKSTEIRMPSPRELVRLGGELMRNLTCEVEVANRGEFESYFPRGLEGVIRGVHDGSLPEGGREFICGPMYGRRYVEGMTRILRSMARHGCSVNSACGLHVHVDGRDLDAFAMRRIGLMYTRLEPSFFKLVSRSRAANHYSKTLKLAGMKLEGLAGLKSSGEIRKYLVKSLYKADLAGRDPHAIEAAGKRLQSEKAGKYHASRYCALNLHSWFHRGTIEFRHSQGTIEVDRVLNWSLLCGWFVELGARLTDREADRVVSMGDLVSGGWKRPGRTIEMPRSVADWVSREHANPTADTPSSDNPSTESEPICDECGHLEEDCECCSDCHRRECVCECSTCHFVECECCSFCCSYPCECEPEEDEEDTPF